jgi:hypothetical protein
MGFLSGLSNSFNNFVNNVGQNNPISAITNMVQNSVNSITQGWQHLSDNRRGRAEAKYRSHALAYQNGIDPKAARNQIIGKGIDALKEFSIKASGDVSNMFGGRGTGNLGNNQQNSMYMVLAAVVLIALKPWKWFSKGKR